MTLLKLSHQQIPVDDMCGWRQLIRTVSQKHFTEVITESRERKLAPKNNTFTNCEREKRVDRRKTGEEV